MYPMFPFHDWKKFDCPCIRCTMMQIISVGKMGQKSKVKEKKKRWEQVKGTEAITYSMKKIWESYNGKAMSTSLHAYTQINKHTHTQTTAHPALVESNTFRITLRRYTLVVTVCSSSELDSLSLCAPSWKQFSIFGLAQSPYSCRFDLTKKDTWIKLAFYPKLMNGWILKQWNWLCLKRLKTEPQTLQ